MLDQNFRATSPRTHLGMAVQQLCEMSSNLRLGALSLRSRLTGAPTLEVTAVSRPLQRRDEGAAPSVTEQLGTVHVALHEANLIMEELHKELSSQ